MANTLSLGSGNWGAKDSLLLGYYEDGKKFFPETFDVTRATGGTRVNKAGLIETPTEILSGELVANGNFATDSDWSKQTGWTISGGKAVAASCPSGNTIGQGSLAPVIGKTYKITFEVSEYTAGGVTVKIGGVQSSSKTSNGNYTVILTPTSAATFSFQVNNISTLKIDNVSVKEYNDKNLARIDYLDDAKGALLTEPQSTNLLTYSQNYNNTYWSKQNGNMLDGGIGLFYLSPLSNVIKYEATTVGYNQMSNRLSSAVTIDTTYTQQGYVKCDNAPYIHFQIHPLTGNPSVVWDNVNKVVISSPASIDNVNIKSLNDGWIKAEITYTATVASQYASIKTYFSTSPTINNSGVPIGTIAFQTFVQVEQENLLGYNGEYATSYIPTFNGIVSRNQDEVNNGGDVNSFGSEGVLYAEIAALANDVTSRSLSLSSGSYSNRIELRYDSSSNGIRVFGVVGGVFQFDSSTTITLTDITKQSKLALKYKENDFALWVNGVEVYSDLSGSVFGEGVLNKLSFSDAQGASPFYGKTKNIQVFNTALSDSDLLSLTTTGSVPYWTQYSAMATSLNYTNK